MTKLAGCNNDTFVSLGKIMFSISSQLEIDKMYGEHQSMMVAYRVKRHFQWSENL